MKTIIKFQKEFNMFNFAYLFSMGSNFLVFPFCDEEAVSKGNEVRQG